MSQDATPARPQQVTTGGWVTVVSAALLVFSTFDQMGKLRTVAKREQIEELLNSGLGKTLGVTVEDYTALTHGALLVLGTAAAAAAVLGFFAMRRHHGARIALSVVAVVIVLASLFADTLLGIFVAVGAAMLWSGPARDWFAGRPVRETPNPFQPREEKGDARRAPQRPEPPRQVQPPAPPVDRPVDTNPVQPPPHPGFGTPTPTGPEPAAPQPTQQPTAPPQGYASPSAPQPAQPEQPAHPYPFGAAGQPPQPTYPSYPTQPTYPAGQQPGLHVSAQLPASRPVDTRPPAPVRWAVLVTVIAAGSLVGIYTLALLVLSVARDEFIGKLLEQGPIRDAGLTAGELTTILFVGAGVVLFWSVSACLLAVFTYRRRNWARLTLVMSAAVAAVFGLVALPLSLLHVAACVAVIVMLAGRAANDWFKGVQKPPSEGPELPKVW